MMTHLAQAYEYDIRVRVTNDHIASDGATLRPRDIGESLVYERDGVKIQAFEVDHGPVKPALGYRIDFAGRSVVLSGDTRVSENLIRHARGVDLLVHEVFVPETLQRAGVPPERAKNIVAYHVTAEEAGQVFTRANPKFAVYSHVCMPTALDQEILSSTRKTYSGPLEIGEDLMVIEVGDTVSVRRPSGSSR
jgi:ribonuclease Z